MAHIALSLQIRAPSTVVSASNIEECVFAAVSALAPAVHGRPTWHVLPLSGRRLSPDVLVLRDRACLTVRLPDADLSHAAGLLSARELRVASTLLRVIGTRVFPLQPHATLLGYVRDCRSRDNIVATLEERYPRTMVQLERTKNLRLHERVVWGTRVRVEGLTDEQSIDLQTHGYGKHKHYGFGVFFPQVHQ